MDTSPLSAMSNDTDESYQDESYQFHANVSPNLARAINAPEFEYKCPDTTLWDTPENPGLDNCNVIIPSYYIKSYNTSVNIDYFTIIKDDIKNCRPLNAYQIEYTKQLSHEEKNEIIEIFNKCMSILVESIIQE